MKKFYILIFILFFTACYENKSGVTMNDFINTVKASTKENAIDCGYAEIRENQFEINTCVTESFEKKLPFYAIYQLQGTDSLVAKGIVYTTDETLFFYHFDSDPSGSASENNGKITKTECIEPIVSGNLDTGYSVFYCQ